MIRCFLIFFALCGSFLSALEDPNPFAPPLFVFQNGARFASPDEAAETIKRLGYQGIGSITPKELVSVQKACTRVGLKVFSIYVGGTVNVDGFRYDPHLKEAIELLKGTGAIVELNLQRGKNPTDLQAIALIQEVADLAKGAGLRVVLYPHAQFHLERFDHALRLAKESGRDNVGVMFNLCHFLKVQPQDDFRHLLTEAQTLLWQVSISGADTDGTSWDQLIRPLDEGSFVQTDLLGHLRQIDFSGPIGLQCYNIKIEAQTNLSRSMNAWKKFLSETQSN